MDKVEDFGKLLGDSFFRNIIYTDESGYVMYNLYTVQKSQGGYTVVRYTDGKTIEFNKLRNAASWAILDRWNKIVESRRVVELDAVIGSLATEQVNHRRLQGAGNGETREINRDKYLNCLDRQRRFQWELDKYIKVAMSCQEKGYQNELKRVARN